MIKTTRCLFKASAIALCLAILSTIANAATINYGNVAFPPSGMALQVTESSGTDPVPLYGPPQPVPGGIDFDPMNFVASSVGGGGDLTDGQLNMTIESPGLLSLSLFESGDYSLLGVPPALATQVAAGAIIAATVTQINGVNITPMPLVPSNASVGFNLVANPGAVQPWSLGTAINIGGQLGPGQRATRVEIQINNQLFAVSQATTAAFIAKKEFFLIGEFIPEPTSAALGALALCGLGMAAARKRS